MATTKKKATTKKPNTTKKAPAKKAPAKKRTVAGRAVHAVSPLRGMPIDDWITQYAKGWQGEVIRRVIDVVKKAAPSSTASLKWRMPVFEANGPFAFVRTAKAHVTVGFWRGNEVEAPIGTFERSERMGHFKLLGPGELDEKALAVMVKSAVKLNAAKGSPAMGGRG